MEKEVHFKDCKLGMKFLIPKYAPVILERLRLYDNYDPNAKKITAAVINIDRGDNSVECELYIDGVRLGGYWFFEHEKANSRICSNLRFMPKKKTNNYY